MKLSRLAIVLMGLLASFRAAAADLSADQFVRERSGRVALLAYEAVARTQGRVVGESDPVMMSAVRPSAGLPNLGFILPLFERGYAYSWRLDDVEPVGANIKMTVFGILWGPDGGDGFGSALASGVDLDGDGIDEIAVGAPEANEQRGRVYVFSGRDATLLWTIEGEVAGDRFGGAVAFAMQPGSTDRFVIVGAPGSASPAGDTGAGRVYVFPWRVGQSLHTISGNRSGMHLGRSVSAKTEMINEQTLSLRVQAGCLIPDQGIPKPALRDYVMTSAPSLQGQSAFGVVVEVLEHFGGGGPEGDLDISSRVDVLDLELSVSRYIAALDSDRIRNPGANEAGDVEELCRGSWQGASSACLRKMCRDIQNALDAHKEWLGLNYFPTVRAAQREYEDSLDLANLEYEAGEDDIKRAVRNNNITGFLSYELAGTGAGIAIGGFLGGFSGPPGAVAGAAAGGITGIIGGGLVWYWETSINVPTMASLKAARQRARDAALAERDRVVRPLNAERDIRTRALTNVIRNAKRCYLCCVNPNQLPVGYEEGCDGCVQPN